MQASPFPTWPPGFWRRIILRPGDGWIGAALEDDAHSFRLRLDHAKGRSTGIEGKAVRHPWTACPGAVVHLRAELQGKALKTVANLDLREHCTHLFDLAILSAAHAADTVSRRFDMQLGDRDEGRATAMLYEAIGDGESIRRVYWLLDGLQIIGPGSVAGLNLRELSRWKRDMPAVEAEYATLLRRAVFVSGVRNFQPAADETAARQAGRMGACYNYQLPQAEVSRRIPDRRRDFSQPGNHPLDDFDASEFNGLKATA